MFLLLCAESHLTCSEVCPLLSLQACLTFVKAVYLLFPIKLKVFVTLAPIPFITNFAIAGGFSLGEGLQSAYISANLDLNTPTKNSYFLTAKKVDFGVLVARVTGLDSASLKDIASVESFVISVSNSATGSNSTTGSSGGSGGSSTVAPTSKPTSPPTRMFPALSIYMK